MKNIQYSLNINKVNFGDQIGTLTYITSVKPLEDNELLEEVNVTHIGIKNLDLEFLNDIDIPTMLFTNNSAKPLEYEKWCASYCPFLYGKIASHVTRKIIRFTPHLIKG